MLYLSNFARPQGAKDKEPRKPKGALRSIAENTAIGAGVGSIGTAGYLKNVINKSSTNEIGKGKFYKQKTYNVGLMRHALRSAGSKKEARKLLRAGKLLGYGLPSAIGGTALGITAGVGTGAYLGGRALINKLKNKNVSDRKG